MTVYYLDSAAGSTASPYDTWAKASLKMATLIALPLTNADTVYVAAGHAETTNGSITLDFPATPGCKVICADKTSGAPPATLATGASIGIVTGSVAFAINKFAYFYGITFVGSNSNSGSSTLSIANSSIPHGLVFESCSFVSQSGHTSGGLNIGQSVASTNDDVYVRLVNCALKFNATSQEVLILNCRLEAVGLTIDAGGSAPTTLFNLGLGVGADCLFEGCNLSGKTWTNLLLWADTQGPSRLRFSHCKFPSGWVALTGTPPGTGGPEVFVNDCNSGDVHTFMGYYTPMGSAVSDTGIYVTAGAAAQSWKIVTTAAVKPDTPFRTPWIDWYNTGTSAITPYIEILRDQSATAWQDNQVWAEFSVKTAGASPLAAISTDKLVNLGTAANQATGAGNGAWTGENATYWSGKCDSGAAVTPAEVGYIRGRICVGTEITGVTTQSLYVDPQIRT